MRRRVRRLCLLLALFAPASGCEIQRFYEGTPLKLDAYPSVSVGQTTRSEILALFGAPNRIFRHRSGDVFVYLYTRRNSDTFTLEEPVFTDLQIFSYTRVDEREDRLVVIFGEDGRVESLGRFQGTGELD